MKRQVKDLIQQRRLHCFAKVGPNSAISEALLAIVDASSSAALVVDGDQLVGIFSEKDYAKAALHGSVSLSAPVKTLMTSKVYYAKPTFTIEECLQIMSKIHIRHLPILEGPVPIALVSMRHIMETLIEDKEAEIRALTSYITGTHLTLDSHQKNNSRPKTPTLYICKQLEAI